MEGSAVFHRATDSWCYPLDGETLHIRIQVKKGDARSIQLWAGDPHDWTITGKTADGHPRYGWNCGFQPMILAASDGERDFWEALYKPPYKRTRYFFLIETEEGVWEYGEKGLFPRKADPRGAAPSAGAADGDQFEGPAGDYWNAFVFPYINQIDVFRAPSWVASTVWYQIFPERFANGNPANDPKGVKAWHAGPVTNHEFYGGDLEGIISRLDHLSELGVNGLYLTPIFSSPSVHKYDTTDYLSIDPAFGTEDDLKRLVEGCHERGIKIILDAVFNHCGTRFSPWRDVLERGAASRFVDWFHIHSFPLMPPGKDSHDSRKAGFETFAFTTGMPKLNTANPEVKDYLLRVARKYVRDFGIDGWRLDVANEIDHQFWREFRTAVKAENPEAYIVGEIWHDSMPWLRGDQYDAVMNYQYGRAVSDFILAKRYAPDARGFLNRIAAIDFSYPLSVIRSAFNVMDSHDTDRFLNRCGGDGDLARLGWVIEWMLPGSPCFYYGDEYGLPGGEDPDNRRCMPWREEDRDQSWYAFFKAMVAMRREHWELLTYGERSSAEDPARPGLLGLAASWKGRRLAALANRSAEAVPAEALEGLLESLGWTSGGAKPILAGKGSSMEGGLGPKGFLVLEGPSPA